MGDAAIPAGNTVVSDQPQIKMVNLVWALLAIGILLPTNLRVYFELRKENPDGQMIQRLMRNYIRTVAIQGAMQIGIIFVMSHLASGVR